jgi:hypothetical protein
LLVATRSIEHLYDEPVATPEPEAAARFSALDCAHQAGNTVGERSLHTREVAGSKSAAPIVRRETLRGQRRRTNPRKQTVERTE